MSIPPLLQKPEPTPTIEHVSPRKPNHLDQMLAAQALAYEHEINLKREADQYELNLHNEQTIKEQNELAALAALYRDNEITAEALKVKNASLHKQVAQLVDKISEQKIKLARQHRERNVKLKKCDHAVIINKKETELKSKENQYEHIKGELETALKQKKKRLT